MPTTRCARAAGPSAATARATATTQHNHRNRCDVVALRPRCSGLLRLKGLQPRRCRQAKPGPATAAAAAATPQRQPQHQEKQQATRGLDTSSELRRWRARAPHRRTGGSGGSGDSGDSGGSREPNGLHRTANHLAGLAAAARATSKPSLGGRCWAADLTRAPRTNGPPH